MSRKRKRRPRTPAAKKSPASGTAREAASQPQPAPTQRRRRADERPPAPWGNAPLAELVILGGIVSLAYGIIGGHETAIGLGVALAGLGGMEVAIREHFAGYRSHTTLLAGVVFVLVTGGLFYLGGLVLAVCLAAGGVAFAASFYGLRRAFQRASGGLSFKAGGLGGG